MSWKAFACFSCGKPMQMFDILSGWCDRCQVMEQQDPEPYVCRARAITSATFGGQEITYLDHGSGDYPSPA